MRKRNLWVVVIVLTLIAAACGGGDDDASPPSGDPIVIGIIADLTGPFTTYGNSLSRSAELAVQEINAAGGIDGRPVEVKTITTTHRFRFLIHVLLITSNGRLRRPSAPQLHYLPSKAGSTADCWVVSTCQVLTTTFLSV